MLFLDWKVFILEIIVTQDMLNIFGLRLFNNPILWNDDDNDYNNVKQLSVIYICSKINAFLNS
jgi:hypothetical protein